MYEGKKRILNEGEISLSCVAFMEVDLWGASCYKQGQNNCTL